MHLAPELTHEPPRHLRKPIINPCEQPENCPRRHYVMEVRDDIIGVVQMKIAEVETQRQTGQTADAKHWQERQRKEHRRVKTDRPAPEREEEASQDDHRRN